MVDKKNMQNTPIKADKFGDDGFNELFAAYQLPLPQFKAKIAELIRSRSVSSRAKQEGFIQDINNVNNKDRLLKKTTDFFMAGEGFKVLQVTKKN